MTDTSDFEIINKEDVPSYHFVSYDVLDSATERDARAADLQRAMLLGNTDHVKIKIFFMTLEGLKEVETTVWASTDESVVLKGGVSVPIHAILKLEFV